MNYGVDLKYFPVGLFASIMGLCGLSIAYQQFEQAFSMPIGIGAILLFFAYLVFTAVSIAYIFKTIRYFPEVTKEFNHPVKTSFFPAISISLLLLSIGTIDLHWELARYLWTIGSVMQFVFTIAIISRWIRHSYDITQVHPAWFLPVVGNIIVSIAGVDFANIELAWFFFSVGLFFGLILFIVVFYRVVFHPQLPDKLMPTLFIFIAPPAVGFISYTKITGQVDSFAHMLLYIALLFVIVLISMAKEFFRLNFYVSWWAYTFPLCAVTIATLVAFKRLGLPIFAWLATALIGLTSFVVGTVMYKTLTAFKQDKVCIPD